MDQLRFLVAFDADLFGAIVRIFVDEGPHQPRRVADFLATNRAAASAAVQRAFAGASLPSRAQAPRSTPRAIAPRRSPDEMTSLRERLYLRGLKPTVAPDHEAHGRTA